MELSDAILVSADKSRGKATRTVLQKLLYLASIKGLVETDFEPHYYGPYSSEIAGLLEDLSSAGLVEETSETVYFPQASRKVRRYRYSLQDGVEHSLYEGFNQEEKAQAQALQRLIDSCEKWDALNARVLSIATKIVYVIDETEKPLTEPKISKRAGELGWKVSEVEISQSTHLLLDLDLVEVEA